MHVAIIIFSFLLLLTGAAIASYFIWRNSQKKTKLKPEEFSKNNQVKCFYSKGHEPMVELWIGNTRTFAVFDSGSSVFWLADKCVGQCADHLKSLCPKCTGNIASDNFTPLKKYGCGICEGCVCAYGGCGGDQPASVCPPGATCDIKIKPNKALINFGRNKVCTYVAVGEGYASKCGGVMGIMGATDFLVNGLDRTSFLFNYYLDSETGGFPTDVMNYSFTMTASPPSRYIDIKLKFQDTDVENVNWIKRYQLKNLNFIVIRLLRIKADDKVIFEPQTGPQYVILDTGTEQGGMWQSDVSSALTEVVTEDDGTTVKTKLPRIEFIFEGEGSEPVSWFYTKSQYMYDMNSLDKGILNPGKTFMFHNAQFPINQLGTEMSLAGNLFLINKRVIVDFLKPRCGSFDVVKPDDLVLQSISLGNPGANQTLTAPKYARTPRIPTIPPVLKPIPPHKKGMGNVLSDLQIFKPLICS
jgi:hypothetical protein